jgi:hypothetical protein
VAIIIILIAAKVRFLLQWSAKVSCSFCGELLWSAKVSHNSAGDFCGASDFFSSLLAEKVH